MKYKISRKLVFYFSITLLTFAIIIGLTFSSMFRQSTKDQSRIDLEMRAQTIAQSVSIYLTDTNSNSGHMMGGGHMRNRNLALYLESLEATTVGEVWVVDKDMNSIDRSHKNGAINIDDLPEDSENMISQALSGMNVFSEGFSDLLNTESVSVGVPVYDEGVIVGAVLLHAPVAGIDAVIQHGYHVLLIYIGVALLLSVLMAYFLSMRFVKPLHVMRDTSQDIASGDYSVRTNIHQNDEIGELAHALDYLARKLHLATKEREQLDHMRNEFFADISHELRTPVTVLRGSLESIQESDLSNPQLMSTYHETMLQEITHLQKLINDLLDFSKMNATDFSLNMETVSLNDIVNDTIRSMRPLSQEKDITIVFDHNDAVYTFYGDYARLRQMITIIVDNAIKFSYPSSVVKIHLNDETLLITDYGKGIPEPDIQNIFHRFYKDEGTDNVLGNGIGLAIAQQIAKRHNISIYVESVVNVETTFGFVFPRNPEDEKGLLKHE